MATAEAGLELPIGLTEQKFLQQLARIEARAIKASNGMAKKFANDNKAIADTFKSAGDSADVFTRELDAMRSKFDPVYAASKRYEAALDELNRAHKLGVLNAKQYEVALERLSREMLTLDNAAGAVGKGAGAAAAGLQNVGYQVQDIFVQVGAGTSIYQALGQQLPQLASGFGVLGGAIGLVAAAAIPLAGYFLTAGEEAQTLGDAIDELEDAVSSYKDAVEAANTPLEELIEKYGRAAGAARLLLEQTERLAKVQALSEVKSSIDTIGTAFEDLGEKVRVIEQAVSTGYGLGDPAAARAAESLSEQFGITADQARELYRLITDAQTASSLAEQVGAMNALSTFMESVASSGQAVTAEFVNMTVEANKGALSVAELQAATEDAEVAGQGLSAAVASIDFSNPISGAQQLGGIMGGLVGQAQALIERLGAAAQAARQRIQSQVANGNPLDPLGAFNGGQSASTAVQVNAGGTVRTPVIPPIVTGGGGGGRKRSGGGGGGSGRAESPFFGDIEKDLTNLQRQLELVGKSNEQVAEARARWELLDEVKRRGMPVNAELNAQINAQAQQFGRLTGELERAEQSQQQFEQAVDGIADSMAGALVAGESLREGLANVLKGIASDILSSGIRNALAGQFGGMGAPGGGGLFGSLFSGLFGGSKAPSFDGGGFTGYGSRSGGIDGRGGFPAILHPNETVVDHTRGQSAGGGDMNINIHVSGARGNAEIQEMVASGVQRGLASYDKALPGRVQQVNASPRRR